MNHADIEAHDIAARYAAGRLAPDEERDFEAHLVDCQRCAAEVESELGLREGLHAIAAEWPSQRFRVPAPPRWLQLAAVLFLAATIVLTSMLVRSSGRQQVLRADAEQQRDRAEQAGKTVADLQRRVAELEGQVKQPRGPAVEPVAPVTVFALTSVRSGGPSDAASLNRLTLGPSDKQVVLTMDLPGPAGGQFSVTLKDRAGRTLWSGGAFRPATPDTLAITLDRTLLSNGAYTMELRQLSPGGRAPVTIGRYAFEVDVR